MPQPRGAASGYYLVRAKSHLHCPRNGLALSDSPTPHTGIEWFQVPQGEDDKSPGAKQNQA